MTPKCIAFEQAFIKERQICFIKKNSNFSNADILQTSLSYFTLNTSVKLAFRNFDVFAIGAVIINVTSSTAT